MTTQASLPNAFTRSAIKFAVAESDYLVMVSLGISTLESMAYRFPKAEDVEEFMQSQVLPTSGFREDDGRIITFPRHPVELWQTFRTGEDAKGIRKLWSYSKEVCKAELEQLATADGGSKQKTSMAVASAMEEKAISKLMPAPISDADRPSLFALTKATQALVGPNANFEHLQWECFISAAQEGKLVRAGKMPKNRAELVLSKGDKLSVREKDTAEAPGPRASDMETFRAYMEIRAKTFAMVEAASYSTYRSLTDRYVSKMTVDPASGMRAPSLNEVRRFDRAMHEQALRWISRDASNLDSAIQGYLNDDSLNLWRLLDTVVSGLPDQGIENSSGVKTEQRSKRKGEESDKDSSESMEAKKEKKAKADKPKKKCLECGKRHEPLCQLTKEIRKKLKEDGKAKKAAAKKRQDKPK